MLRTPAILLLVFLISRVCLPQYPAPDWVRKCPGEQYQNYYFCGDGVNRGFGKAREMAFANALRKVESNYNFTSVTEIYRTPTYDNTRIRMILQGENLIRNVRVVDTYHYETLRGNHVWMLISIPKPEHKQNPLPSNLGAFTRSIILPGWGHFYKKQYERGMLFLAIEVVAGALAVSSWITAQKNPEFQQQAISMSVLTIAVHLLNIIDATTIRHNIRWY